VGATGIRSINNTHTRTHTHTHTQHTHTHISVSLVSISSESDIFCFCLATSQSDRLVRMTSKICSIRIIHIHVYTYIYIFLSTPTCIRIRTHTYIYTHICLSTPSFHLLNQRRSTGWRRPTGCLNCICFPPQKSPIISGSFAENDLQLEASYGSWPPCAYDGKRRIYFCNTLQLHNTLELHAFFAVFLFLILQLCCSLG